MSKETNKIKNIFDKQNESLPEGFWEELEPNIPQYNQKKRKLFGVPFWGCLGTLTLISMIGIGTYLLGYWNTSQSESELAIVSNTPLKTDAAISQTLNESILENPKEINLNTKNTKTNNGATNSRKKAEDVTSSPVSNYSEVNVPDQLTRVSNAKSNSLKTKNIPYVSNRSVDENNSVALINKSDSQGNFNLDKRSKVKATAHGDIDLSNQVVAVVSIQNAIDEKVNITKVNQEELDRLPFRFSLLDISKITCDWEYSEPKKPFIIDYTTGKNRFVEGGYNLLFTQRELITNRNSASSNLDKKINHERDFISHDAYLKYGYHLNKHIFITGGLNYTIIQELFDFSYDIVNTSNITFSEGRRIIKNTNKLSMLDASIGLGFEKQWTRYTVGASAGASYNVYLYAKGIELDNKNEIRQIVRSELYDNNVGMSLGVNFHLGYKLTPNLELKLNGGTRNYLENFTNHSEGFPFQIRYTGASLGLALKQQF